MLRPRTIPPQFESKPIAEVADAIGLEVEEDRHPWYTCCCPFHLENNPSFRVNLDENYFCCFGCEAKGDVLELMYLWRSRTNPSYTRYDAYLEVRAGDPSFADQLVVGFVDVDEGPRALGAYLAAARSTLSREQADRLVVDSVYVG